MKNYFFIYLVLLPISIFFFGCTATQIPTKSTIYTPAINQVATTEIGQNMFEKVYALYKYEKSVKLLDQHARQKYKEDQYTKYYFKKQSDNSCVMIDTFDAPVLVDYNCNNIFTHYMKANFSSYSAKKLDKPIKYEIIQATPSGIDEDSFKYVVLYQGKVGNKLKITFQEFISSYNQKYGYKEGFVIRDAYTQNIDYELDENGKAIIGFKGLRIKVLKATNFDITYQVISDYK